MPNILRSWLETRRQAQVETAPVLSNDAPAGQFGDLQSLIDRSFKAARVGIWECTLPDETLRWTDTVFELFDLEPQSKISRDYIVSLYSEQSRAELKRVRDRALAEGDGFTLDACITTARGNLRWIRITAIVEQVDGRPVRLFGMKQDITAERMLFDQIRRMTEVDSLTGLASRSRFEAMFNALCADPGGVPHALLLIDLDGFKAVNDTLGHQAGDGFLKLTAERLCRAAPDAALCARIGGDEFALLHHWQDPADLAALGRRLADGLNDPHTLSGHGLCVSASVGGAVIVPGRSADETFLRADRALYGVKSGGKGTFGIDMEP